MRGQESRRNTASQTNKQNKKKGPEAAAFGNLGGGGIVCRLGAPIPMQAPTFLISWIRTFLSCGGAACSARTDVTGIGCARLQDRGPSCQVSQQDHDCSRLHGSRRETD